MSIVPFFGLPGEEVSPWRIPPIFHRSYYSPWNHFSRVEPTFDRPVPDTITKEKGNFQVTLDVQNFDPSEIVVKTVNGEICVEGSHEEKEEGHAKVSRSFVKKYKLPKDHDADDVKATFMENGMLVILAPKRKPLAKGERIVPILSSAQAHGSRKGNASPKATSSASRSVPVPKIAPALADKKQSKSHSS